MREKGRRSRTRRVLALTIPVAVALFGLNYKYGIAPSHWWLRLSRASVALDGAPVPTLSVYRSLRGDVLLFIPEHGFKTPYFVDVHQPCVLIPNGDEALVLPGIAISKEGGPAGVQMPNSVVESDQPQQASDVFGTADFRWTNPQGFIQLAGIIEVPSNLVIRPHYIEFTTMMTRQRVRVTW